MSSEIDKVIGVLIDHFRFVQPESGFQSLLQSIERNPDQAITLVGKISKLLEDYYVITIDSDRGTAILPCSQTLRDYEAGDQVKAQLIKIEKWHFGREALDKTVKWRHDDRGMPLAPLISETYLLEFERNAKRAELLNKIEVGQKIKGTVKTVVDYGIFVDIGGMAGLISGDNSQYSVGDEVDVVISDFDRQRERVSLRLG